MLKRLILLASSAAALATMPALAQTATPLVIAGGGGGGYLSGGGNGQTGGNGGMNPRGAGYGGSGGTTGGGGGGSYLDAALVAVGGLPAVDAAGGDGFITITYLPVGAAAVSQTFGYTGAAQSYTFQSTGLYDIIAAGAQGGAGPYGGTGGLGAEIGGEGTFAAGTVLSLIVGGGGSAGSTYSGNGGGGSFVFETSVAPAAVATGAVPEPASWAMMIGGFGLIGGALRRRRVATGSIRRPAGAG